MIFFVFSYNRGPHLENCIHSIEQCVPDANITVYDDDSNDLETQEILARIATRHKVFTAHDKDSRDQHGSLYANMQRALDSVGNDEIIFFMQDDAQLIRPLEAEDLDFIKGYFDKHPKGGFLAPVFQKRITRQRTLDRFIHNEDLGVYICHHRSRIEVAGVYYSDISITSSKRLREAGWRFLMGEYENEKQAKSLFTEMGYLFAPLAMQLPNTPAYRNKKKSLAFRLGEKMNKAGLYPFRIMQPDEVARLRARPTSQVPIAEDFLSVTVPGLRSPWIFHPLKRSRLLRKLDKLEVFLRGLPGLGH